MSEADHPLLCEGTRRQRGELAVSMIVHYKDDQHKLSKVPPPPPTLLRVCLENTHLALATLPFSHRHVVMLKYLHVLIQCRLDEHHAHVQIGFIQYTTVMYM